MRLSPELITAASFNPTKKSHQMSIVDMCQGIESQQITLPLYQRDLSWTIEKCISLLNYQLLGKAPVAPISFNVITDTASCVPQVTFLDRDKIAAVQRGQYSVVDGQQRLSTNYKAYINHEDFTPIVLDLSCGRFFLLEKPPRTNQIPVGILLNKEDSVLFRYVAEKPSLSKPEVTNLLIQIRSKFKNYNYTINSADNLSEEEQVEWFEVLNNAGSLVSIIQMRFAKLKVHGIDIYTQYTNRFVRKLLQKGYNLFVKQKTSVSYPVAALNPAYEKLVGKAHSPNYTPIPSDTKENQLCALPPDALVACFDLTLEALDHVLQFLQLHSLKPPARIEYINYLIGYFVFNGKEISPAAEDALVRWYSQVDFNNMTNTNRRDVYTELISLR